MKNELFTVQEVAACLRLSALTIYKYIKEGKIESCSFGGHYRISQKSLDHFVSVNKVIPTGQECAVSSHRDSATTQERNVKSEIKDVNYDVKLPIPAKRKKL